MGAAHSITVLNQPSVIPFCPAGQSARPNTSRRGQTCTVASHDESPLFILLRMAIPPQPWCPETFSDSRTVYPGDMSNKSLYSLPSSTLYDVPQAPGRFLTPISLSQQHECSGQGKNRPMQDFRRWRASPRPFVVVEWIARSRLYHLDCPLIHILFCSSYSQL